MSITRRADHPYIFRKMCRPADHAPGTLVEVVDASGAIVGTGIYNRKSQIAVRLLSQDAAAPADENFILRRIQDAIRLRQRVFDLDASTNAYRIVNSEADGLSGLIADRYADFVVLELFSAGWFRQLKFLMETFGKLFAEKGRPARVLVRADADVQEMEGFRVRDYVAEALSDADLRVTVHEGPVKFSVDLRHGHKTGFFCDQRDNRALVAKLSRGKNLLDAFCYSAGFSCRSLVGDGGGAGAAKYALAVDLDERAIELARENAVLNRVQSRFDARHGDVFHVLRELASAGKKFGVIVLDPPKLASDKSELDRALVKYADMNRLALPLLEKDGVLVSCSCSGVVSESALLGVLRRAASDAGVYLQHFQINGPAPDHLFASAFPEGRYLQAIYSRAIAR